MTLNNLSLTQQRILVGSLFAIFVTIAISLSHISFFSPLFALIISSGISLVVWEYYRLAQIKGYRPLTWLGITGTIIYGFACYLSSRQSDITTTLPELTLVAILLLAFLYSFFKGEHPYINLAITFFAIAYLTVPLSAGINIVYFFSDDAPQDGRWWFFYLLFITKMTDVGAYFAGKAFGQTKLAPYISPGKTWEGAIGGFVTAIVGSFIFYLISKIFGLSIYLTFFQSIWLAALLSIIAQIGDLAESLLKRDIGVKDSSNLPGLGGMLDVSDSLVFTTPFVYLFLKLQFA